MSSPHTFDTSSNKNVIGGDSLLIVGDDDPQDFSFEDGLDASAVLALIIRSGKARKIFWFVDQAFKLGIEFKKEQPITAPKHDEAAFPFETFMDWIKWTGAYEEIQKGIKWTEAFGKGATFFFLENDQANGTYKETKLPFYDEIDNPDFTSCKSLYPKVDGIGYELIETEDDINKTPMVYKVTLKNNDKTKDEIESKIEYYVHASRVVTSAAEQIRLTRTGESSLQCAGKYIQVQDQILRAVFATANNVQAGIQAIRVANITEATALKTKMNNHKLDRLLKLFYKGELPLDDLFKYVIPDLKTGQLTELYLISQKEIATGLGISIKRLGEEDVPAGFGVGGKEEGEQIIVDRTHHIQNHYQRFAEECFYKLGKEDTSFEWIQPKIEEERSDFEIGIKNKKDEENVKNNNKSEENVKDV